MPISVLHLIPTDCSCLWRQSIAGVSCGMLSPCQTAVATIPERCSSSDVVNVGGLTGRTSEAWFRGKLWNQQCFISVSKFQCWLRRSRYTSLYIYIYIMYYTRICMHHYASISWHIDGGIDWSRWKDGQVDRGMDGHADMHGFDCRTLVGSRRINQTCSICELVPEILFRLKKRGCVLF